jgi:hypothetical protein
VVGSQHQPTWELAMLQSKQFLPTPRRERADRLTQWSWVMVPTFVLVFLVSNAAYLPVLLGRGQREGACWR